MLNRPNLAGSTTAATALPGAPMIRPSIQVVHRKLQMPWYSSRSGKLEKISDGNWRLAQAHQYVWYPPLDPANPTTYYGIPYPSDYKKMRFVRPVTPNGITGGRALRSVTEMERNQRPQRSLSDWWGGWNEWFQFTDQQHSGWMDLEGQMVLTAPPLDAQVMLKLEYDAFLPLPDDTFYSTPKSDFFSDKLFNELCYLVASAVSLNSFEEDRAALFGQQGEELLRSAWLQDRSIRQGTNDRIYVPPMPRTGSMIACGGGSGTPATPPAPVGQHGIFSISGANLYVDIPVVGMTATGSLSIGVLPSTGPDPGVPVFTQLPGSDTVRISVPVAPGGGSAFNGNWAVAFLS